MRRLFIILLVLAPFTSFTQSIPNKANLIKVKVLSFSQVCNTLLDSGYTIEKRDVDLQTVSTEMREYSKSYNAAYKIRVRVKDSVAYISAAFTAPWWDPFTKSASKTDPLWKDVRSVYLVDNKGRQKSKTLHYYPFQKMVRIAEALGGSIEYLVEN